ncbi:hypothetical protein BJX68DRAFT_135172 [Aspergillus pseudodeflectus]|uniref:Uncharacterized protein n=1 Tax=Aspergillus pseudodeflectus TaxID=176178 RepID=A0ABR4K289_9EURO
MSSPLPADPTSTTNDPPTTSTPEPTGPTGTQSDTTTTTTTDPPSSTEPTTTTSSTTTTEEPPESTETSETSTTTTTTRTTTTTDAEPTTTSEPTTSSEPDPTSTTSDDVPTTGTTTTTITITDTSTPSSTTDGGATSTIESSATATPTETGGGGGGLSAGGTIAVAVVVPVVSVAILVLVGLWLWRRHKAKKVAEEERRKEVEEYGFNPNGDPTLPAVMGGAATDDNSGYRGWGTTSAGRKASTNMSSSVGAGLAMSEAGSQPGYHHAATPSDGTIQFSDGHVTEPHGILGAAPVAAAATANNQRNADIHRGPSNASSAYSAGNHSDISEESHMSATHPGGPYYDENPYYTDVQQQYGGYSDPYAGSQPVIRDVQARRNTQIQNPSVFPRQGNAGIAQNF